MLFTKKIILGALIFPATVFAQSPKEVESATKSVTIYLRGVKETREASVQVSNGEQQLLFTNLPQRLNPSTIRLGASDFLQIVSINHRLNYINANEEENIEIKLAKDSLQFYNDQINLKQGVYNSLQSTRSMVLANKSVKGDKEGMQAEDVTDLLDFYREKLNDINVKSLTIERQLETLRTRRDKFQKEYNKLVAGKTKSYSELMVTVRSKQSAKAKFTIEYFTPDAGWTPHYDIRNNEAASKLEITSHATMWQKTGYDWKNVDITLSTLDPQFNINAPELRAQTLELGQNYYKQNQEQSYQLYRQQMIMLDSVQVNMDPQGKDKNKEISQTIQLNNAINNMNFESGPSTSSGPGTMYKIATPYSIASNGKDTKIEIERKWVAASFKYKTVPKVEKAVFLMATITGWDTLNYYSGNANVFNNGTFVGTVYLNTQTVQDTLEISLGQDKSFSVEYEVVSTKTFSSTSGSSFKKGKGFIIKIMNKKSTDVIVEIVDQSPLTTTQEVNIETDKGDGVTDPSTGFITWRRNIASGQKVEIPISYVVKYPKEHNLYNF
jgi:uncharacterized protein (TIGR02231 family)